MANPVSIGISSPENTITIFNSPVVNAGTIAIDLNPTGVMAGRYENPAFVLNKFGQIVNIVSNSFGPLSEISLSSSSLNISPKIITREDCEVSVNLQELHTAKDVQQTFVCPSISIDTYGRIISIKSSSIIPGMGTVTSVAIRSDTLDVSPSYPITSSGTFNVELKEVVEPGKWFSPSITVDKYGRVIQVASGEGINIKCSDKTLTVRDDGKEGVIYIGLASPVSTGARTVNAVKSITINKYGQVLKMEGAPSYVFTVGKIENPYPTAENNYSMRVNVAGLMSSDYVFVTPVLENCAFGLRPVDDNSSLCPSIVSVNTGYFEVTTMKQPQQSKGKPPLGNNKYNFSYNYCVIRNGLNPDSGYHISYLTEVDASRLFVDPSSGIYETQDIAIIDSNVEDMIFLTAGSSTFDYAMQPLPITDKAIPSCCLAITNRKKGYFRLTTMKKPESGSGFCRAFVVSKGNNSPTIDSFGEILSPYSSNGVTFSPVFGLDIMDDVFLLSQISAAKYGFRQKKPYGCWEPTIVRINDPSKPQGIFYQTMLQPLFNNQGNFFWMTVKS